MYLKLYDGKYKSNSTIVLQIELEPALSKEVQADGKFILWSTPKPKFVTCLLLKHRQLIAKFSVSMVV